MKANIDKSFEVEQSVDVVWKYLSNPEEVVTCVPGAKITERIDDTNYKGAVSLKIGPVTSSFSGQVTLEKLDEAASEMVIFAKGSDAKGKGNASMRLSGIINNDGGMTKVDTSMELSITGKLAQFGARMITDVSNHIFEQFVNNFKAMLAEKAETPSEPVATESDESTATDQPEQTETATTETEPIKAEPTKTTPPPAQKEPEPIRALPLFFTLIKNAILRLFGRKVS
ncbi:MAG: SRPBCC family protein [Bacteroidota bacterium]